MQGIPRVQEVVTLRDTDCLWFTPGCVHFTVRSLPRTAQLGSPPFAFRTSVLGFVLPSTETSTLLKKDQLDRLPVDSSAVMYLRESTVTRERFSSENVDPAGAGQMELLEQPLPILFSVGRGGSRGVIADTSSDTIQRQGSGAVMSGRHPPPPPRLPAMHQGGTEPPHTLRSCILFSNADQRRGLREAGSHLELPALKGFCNLPLARWFRGCLR